ncbi:hypothetical protein PTUN_a2649 [Pseudoalteromonas tunicata]|nr:hypothetical protein PTUN_a2649 [Pseudoalteromonas tunicata]
MDIFISDGNRGVGSWISSLSYYGLYCALLVEPDRITI